VEKGGNVIFFIFLFFITVMMRNQIKHTLNNKTECLIKKKKVKKEIHLA